MKKLLYLASIATALALSSCNDFLTVESPDFSSAKYWRDKTDVEAGLSSIYGQLENRTNPWGFCEIRNVVETFRGDDVNIGADVYNYPEWVALHSFTYTNENSSIKNYWMNNYNGINYANDAIVGIDKVQEGAKPMSDEDYKSTMGEARFLRAYYHFKLLLNWEKIIIRDQKLAGEAYTHRALSERIACWDFICGEFNAVASMLPTTRVSAEAGRATSGAANAYLGWSYLTRAYEESAKKSEYLTAALTALNQVTGYSLEENFQSMFDGTNKNSPESIFEIQFTNSTADGARHKHVFHSWIAPPTYGGWDEIRLNEKMYNEYIKEGRTSTVAGNYDNRVYGSMIFNDAYYQTGEKALGKNYEDWFEDATEVLYCYRKFLPATIQDFDQELIATNVPVMRYANVMLMKAEILNEQGAPGAKALIDELRTKHGKMPALTDTSPQDIRAAIEHERMVEFALENYRFYDLRRWGKLKDAMEAAGRTGFNIAKHSFLPIPLAEINANNMIN